MHLHPQYHIYALPTALVDTLTPRSLVDNTPPRSPTPEQATTVAPSGPRTCNICLGVTFVDLEAQRAHFRSDWHRYNVKTRLAGGSLVDDVAFAQLIDDLEDSLSGSASSEDEDDSQDSDMVNTLMNKTRLLPRPASPDDALRHAPQTALAWFHSAPSTQIGIYKAVFSNPKDPSSYLSELHDMQLSGDDGRIWALFMVAGGHFAGAVVRVSSLNDENVAVGVNPRKKKSKIPRSDVEVLRHKTFHRYTTRRKQGGSQSLNDNAKGNANSAGAQLRRYGEQALREDIRGLMSEWAEDVSTCDRIWIRASSSNRKIFFDYGAAIISKGDERLRTFPFPTRRPTQSEVSRCLLELTKAKVSYLTEDALRARDEAYLTSISKPKVIASVPILELEKPKQPKLSKEEEILREKWLRLIEMVKKDRVEPLKAFWERESSGFGSVDVPIPAWASEQRATLLQLSAQVGSEEVTRWLLEEAQADPTIPLAYARPSGQEMEDQDYASEVSDIPVSLSRGSYRVAYDLARSKGVRDVFRRCANAHPDRWDWYGAARVPSALNKQMEDERDEKKKLRRKGLKERVKEREAREREKVKEQLPVDQKKDSAWRQEPPSTLSSHRLGGVIDAAEGVAGLTPEMRAKVERERRARAAEARVKVLGTK
ncbi:hypothetical protein BDZ94DRAFT_1260234 [Collybia nuda]|uniref:VLRF1 domain-containing protein n=1 Tax=Collybia nuda TaxID=64659 RepID=A0A9P5Y440_9AGAR|nr:hypothetical protein BDZ94DRAFT_1260234 [Collybia nuda]